MGFLFQVHNRSCLLSKTVGVANFCGLTDLKEHMGHVTDITSSKLTKLVTFNNIMWSLEKGVFRGLNGFSSDLQKFRLHLTILNTLGDCLRKRKKRGQIGLKNKKLPTKPSSFLVLSKTRWGFDTQKSSAYFGHSVCEKLRVHNCQSGRVALKSTKPINEQCKHNLTKRLW